MSVRKVLTMNKARYQNYEENILFIYIVVNIMNERRFILFKVRETFTHFNNHIEYSPFHSS